METHDLFGPEYTSGRPEPSTSSMPLAARMRPERLGDFVGQVHLLAPGQLLERMIRQDCFSSIVLYGPPGTGKTTLAHIIANETRRRFVSVSAVVSNVAEIRRLVIEARSFLTRGQKTILFVDELHRFNKAQQDVLLPHIENGVIAFIGATTHNPFFSIIAPLVSRSQVFRLKALTAEEIKTIVLRALAEDRKGLGRDNIEMEPEALEQLSLACQGDARRALNCLEIAAASCPAGVRRVSAKDIVQSMEERPVVYDRDEDQHYDTISAFIKSVRGSDPDAALYWLAKMIHAGEDILFIARRLVILASEDVGNADPQALQIAASCLDAVNFIGLPEARIPLAQATIYLSCAPKSNASYLAIERALETVQKERIQDVPAHLKNVQGPDEAGAKYLYPHDFEGHIVGQSYLEQAKKFLELSGIGFEAEMQERLKRWRNRIQNRSPESGLSGPERP